MTQPQSERQGQVNAFIEEAKTYNYPTEPIAHLAIPAKHLKMIRESLCRGQWALGAMDLNSIRSMADLQTIIKEIDRHRPLASDGKHGNLHTPTCGCESND